MPKTLSGNSTTVQQRGVEATRQLREMLGLDDLKLLSTALAEFVVEESSHNPGVAVRIRAIYSELSELKSRRATPARKPKATDVELIPLMTLEGWHNDPYAALDPYFLQHVYGDGQLRAALTGYSLDRLKTALKLVEEKHPGTRPKTRSRKADLIDYIVEHVAGTTA